MKKQYKITPVSEEEYYAEYRYGNGLWNPLYNTLSPFPSRRFKSYEAAKKAVDEDKDYDLKREQEREKKARFQRMNPPVYL